MQMKNQQQDKMIFQKILRTSTKIILLHFVRVVAAWPVGAAQIAAEKLFSHFQSVAS